MVDPSLQQTQKEKQQGDCQVANSSCSPLSSAPRHLQNAYGRRAFSFGDDGLNHVRFDDEGDAEDNGSTAIPNDCDMHIDNQDNNATHLKHSSHGWGHQAAGKGRVDKSSMEDYRAVPPPSRPFEGQRPSALPEHATDILTSQCISAICLREDVEVDYSSVLSVFQKRLESLLVVSRSDPATQDFLAHVSKALVGMYLTTDTSKLAKRAKITQTFWGTDLLLRMLLQTLHQCLPSWKTKSDKPTTNLGAKVSTTTRTNGGKPDDQPTTKGASICIDISDEEDMVEPGRSGIHGSRRLGSAIHELQLAVSAGRPKVGGWDVKALEDLKAELFSQLDLDTRKLGALASFLQFILPPKETTKADSTPVPSTTQSKAVAATAAAPLASIPAPPAYIPPSQSDLTTAVQQLAGQGCGIAALAALETTLCKQFSASHFAQLGAGPSLLGALSTRPEWVEMLTGSCGGDGPCRAPLSEVLHLVSDVLQQNVTSDTGSDPMLAESGRVSSEIVAAIAATLRRQYGVRNIQALGHGSVLHLVQMALAQFHIGELQLTPWLRHALVLTSTAIATQPAISMFGSSSHLNVDLDGVQDHQVDVSMYDVVAEPGMGAVVGVLGDVGRSRAVAVLRSVAEMSDLHSSSCWDAVFEPELGSLEDFVRKEGAACGIAALSLLPPTLGSPSLSLPCGRLLKVRYGATAGDIIDAACKGDVLGTASCLLSLLASSGGVRGSPMGLISQHMRGCLEAIGRAEETGTTGWEAGGSDNGQQSSLPSISTENSPRFSAGSPSAKAACRFVLKLLLALPPPLPAALAPRLMLEPLSWLLLGDESVMHAALMSSCTCPAEVSTLHMLGMELGVEPWREDWKKRRCWDQTHTLQPNTTFSATIAATDGTIAVAVSLPTSARECVAAAAGAVIPAARSVSAAAAAVAATSKDLGLKPAVDADEEVGFIQVHMEDTVEEAGLLHSSPSATLASGVLAADGSPSKPCSERVEQERVALVSAAHVTKEEEAECRAIVDRIREEEFGVGLQLEGQAGGLRERQNARLGRALDRLSVELYSKDTHFVLELVQNADDNTYAAGITPRLCFTLTHDMVLVSNNECGFKEVHIRALCDVGRSTKSRMEGYIGQKGIGFKSVYRVTNAPEIHSGGFHVAFDINLHQALGYVLPEWREERVHVSHHSGASRLELSPAVGTRVMGMDVSWATTRIVLPLKAEMREGGGGAMLRQRFEGLSPLLLLFLQRLRCIAVCDNVSGREVEMERKEGPLPHLTLLTHRCGDVTLTTQWLVVNAPLSPHLARLGTAINVTTLSLAFPLPQHSQQPAGNGAQQQPPQQQVYAFLPLRSYGLRFVVQADWVLPSSRESLDSDSPWNQMLRSEVPRLFLTALEKFKCLPSELHHTSSGPQQIQPSNVQISADVADQIQPGCQQPQLQQQHQQQQGPNFAALDRWLRSIPLEGEAQGFFSSLPAAIAAYLRAASCIPCVSDASPSPTATLQACRWVVPGQAVVCRHSGLLQLLASLEVTQLMGLYFVDPRAGSLYESHALRRQLGVREFGIEELLELLQVLCSRGQLPSLGVAWVSRLLLLISDLLSGSSGTQGSVPSSAMNGRSTSSSGFVGGASLDRPSLIRRLRRLPLLPLQDGSFVSIHQASDSASATSASRAGLASSTPNSLTACHEATAATRVAVFFTLPDPSHLRTPDQQKIAAGGNSLQQSNTLQRENAAALATSKVLHEAGISQSDIKLRFLHCSLLLGCKLAEDYDKIQQMLQELGVQYLTTSALMWGHVLPTLASPTARSLPSDKLVSLLAVPLLAKLIQPAAIHTNAITPSPPEQRTASLAIQPPHTISGTQPAQQMWQIRAGPAPLPDGGIEKYHVELCTALLLHAIVVTAAGTRIQMRQTEVPVIAANQQAKGSDSKTVYLPVSLGGAADWDTEFPEACFEVLCGDYSRKFPQLKEEWRWLFLALGAKIMPPPVQVPRLLKQDSVRAQSLSQPTVENASVANLIPAAGEAGWNLDDWICPDLLRLLQMLLKRSSQSPQGEMRRIRRFANLLSTHWHFYQPAMWALATPYSNAVLTDAQPQPSVGVSVTVTPQIITATTQAAILSLVQQIPSFLQLMLRDSKWMSSTSGTGELFSPNQLHIHSPAAVEMFGTHVNYTEDLGRSSTGVENNTSMIRDLKVQCSTDPATILLTLKCWAADTASALAADAAAAVAATAAAAAGSPRFVSAPKSRSQAKKERRLADYATAQPTPAPMKAYPGPAFVTSLALMQRIYIALASALSASANQSSAPTAHQNLALPGSSHRAADLTTPVHAVAAEIVTAFKLLPLVWLPDAVDSWPAGDSPPASSRAHTLELDRSQSGHFYSTDQLCHQDPDGVLQSLRILLTAAGTGLPSVARPDLPGLNWRSATSGLVPRAVSNHYPGSRLHDFWTQLLVRPLSREETQKKILIAQEQRLLTRIAERDQRVLSRKAARLQAANELKSKRDALTKRQEQELVLQQDSQSAEKEKQLQQHMTEDREKQAKRIRRHARAALVEKHRVESELEVSGLQVTSKETELAEDAKDMEVAGDDGAGEESQTAAGRAGTNGSGVEPNVADIVPLVATSPSMLQLVHCCRTAAAVAQAAAVTASAAAAAAPGKVVSSSAVQTLQRLMEKGKDLVRCILTLWASQLQQQQLTLAQLAQLKQLLADVSQPAVIPVSPLPIQLPRQELYLSPGGWQTAANVSGLGPCTDPAPLLFRHLLTWGLLVNDDPHLATRVRSLSGVYLIEDVFPSESSSSTHNHIPTSHSDRGGQDSNHRSSGNGSTALRVLFSSLGIRNLSSAITTLVLGQGLLHEPFLHHQGYPASAPSHTLPAMVRHALPYCQRYLLSSCSPEMYKHHADAITPHLPILKVQLCQHIQLCYSLTPPDAAQNQQQQQQQQVVVSDVAAAWDAGNSTLHILQANVHSFTEVAREVASMLSGSAPPSSRLTDFVYTLLLAMSSHQPLQHMMDHKGCGAPLPESLAPWVPPEPLAILPPVPPPIPPPNPPPMPSLFQPQTSAPSITSPPDDDPEPVGRQRTKRKRTANADNADVEVIQVDSDTDIELESGHVNRAKRARADEGGAGTIVSRWAAPPPAVGPPHGGMLHQQNGYQMPLPQYPAWPVAQHAGPYAPHAYHAYDRIPPPGSFLPYQSHYPSARSFQVPGAGPHHWQHPHQQQHPGTGQANLLVPLQHPVYPSHQAAHHHQQQQQSRWQQRDAATAAAVAQITTVALPAVTGIAARMEEATRRLARAAARGPSTLAATSEVQQHHVVGRVGEETVFRHLKQQQLQLEVQQPHVASSSPAGDIIAWVNEEEESQLPYDLTITDSVGAVTYVEVKSSASADKAMFEVSYHELRFAEQHGPFFHIYRVCGALGGQPTLTVLQDPVAMWKKGIIKLCLVS